jgi:hypothetical protein
MLQKIIFIFFVLVLFYVGCNKNPETSINAKKINIDIAKVYTLTDKGLLIALSKMESENKLLIYDIFNSTVLKNVDFDYETKSDCLFAEQNAIAGTIKKEDGTWELFILEKNEVDIKLPKIKGYNPVIYDSNDKFIVGKYQNHVGQDKPLVINFEGEVTEFDFSGVIYKINADNTIIGKSVEDGEYFFIRGDLDGINDKRPCQEYSSILDINSNGAAIVQNDYVLYEWCLNNEMQKIQLDNMNILSAKYADDSNIIATCLSKTKEVTVSVYIEREGDVFCFYPDNGVIAKTFWDKKNKSVFGYIVNNGVFYWKPTTNSRHFVNHSDWKELKNVYPDCHNEKGDIIIRLGKDGSDSVKFYYVASPYNSSCLE